MLSLAHPFASWASHATWVVHAAGMEGGPAQQPSRGLSGEAMVVTPRGDSVRVPFFKNSHLGDNVWAVPLVVFWQAVLQDPIMPKKAWKVEAQVHSSRDATPEELAKLQRQMYLSTGTTQELMVPLDGLIDCLEELALRINTIDATVKSLMDVQTNSSGDVVAHRSAMGGFAQPQPCTLTQSKANEVFSLRAEYQEYFEDGTLLMEQLDECYGFLLDPPVGCGLTHPIPEPTIDIWWDSAQEFLGYLKKHEGMEPSFEHLRNTILLAKFYSFRLARENGWNTMKIEFQNLSNLMVFVFYPGNFSGLPAVPESEKLATEKWLKEIIARARREAQLPENRKRKATSAHLWQVWEAQEGEWKAMKQEYEVRMQGCPFLEVANAFCSNQALVVAGQ